MRPSSILKERIAAVKKIATKYEGKGLSNLRVFGSVADGTDTENSDIDFLVDLERPVSLFTIGGMHYELENALGCSIDLVMTRQLPNRVRDKILMEAKPI